MTTEVKVLVLFIILGALLAIAYVLRRMLWGKLATYQAREKLYQRLQADERKKAPANKRK